MQNVVDVYISLLPLQSKEGDRGSKRSADDSDTVRTAWELARDQHMSKQVENYNVRKMKLKWALY